MDHLESHTSKKQNNNKKLFVYPEKLAINDVTQNRKGTKSGVYANLDIHAPHTPPIEVWPTHEPSPRFQKKNICHIPFTQIKHCLSTGSTKR